MKFKCDIFSSPRPVIVEPLEQKDDEEGYPEKVLPKNSNQYLKERDVGPRFALHNTFEYELSQKWKQLYELEKQKRDNLEKEIASDRERLDDSMEFALYEHETNILRESKHTFLLWHAVVPNVGTCNNV